MDIFLNIFLLLGGGGSVEFIKLFLVPSLIPSVSMDFRNSFSVSAKLLRSPTSQLKRFISSAPKGLEQYLKPLSFIIQGSHSQILVMGGGGGVWAAITTKNRKTVKCYKLERFGLAVCDETA